IWFTGPIGVSRWRDGQVTIYGKRSSHLRDTTATTTASARELTGTGTPNQALESLFEDDRGRIWLSSNSGLGYLHQDHYTPIRAVPAGIYGLIAKDTRGDLWISHLDLGLYHLLPNGAVQQFSWASLGRQDGASALSADPQQGGLWLGFYNGGLSYFK